MSVTLSQKLGMLALPAGAVVLAWATSGPDWNPKTVQRSWRAAMHPAAPAPEAKPVEAPPAPEAKPAGPGRKKVTKVAVPRPEEKPPAEKPPVAEHPPAEAPKPKAPAGPPELEFRLTGLAPCRSAAPLTVPSHMRLDIHVMPSGAVRLGPDFADPEMAMAEIRSGASDKKREGLLFLVPNIRAPWDGVRDLAAGGVAANWTRVALCVASPENPGQGRVLLLDVPASAAPSKKGLDLLNVKVLPAAGATTSYEVNGEKCDTAEALAKKVKAFHQDYEEGFEAGYSENPDETPWTVDGAGAMAGGVVAALDALKAAGVKSVRLAGIRREAR